MYDVREREREKEREHARERKKEREREREREREGRESERDKSIKIESASLTRNKQIALIRELDRVDASIMRQKILPVEILGIFESSVYQAPTIIDFVVDLPCYHV